MQGRAGSIRPYSRSALKRSQTDPITGPVRLMLAGAGRTTPAGRREGRSTRHALRTNRGPRPREQEARSVDEPAGAADSHARRPSTVSCREAALVAGTKIGMEARGVTP